MCGVVIVVRVVIYASSVSVCLSVIGLAYRKGRVKESMTVSTH